jgi:hypothetical protein
MTIRRTTVVALLSGVLLGAAVTLLYTAHTRALFTDKTNTDLKALRASYVTASHDTASNKVIDESRGVVVDCQNRARFENLLSRLRTLSESERTELDATFPACAPYQVTLKKFHLARLEHIIEQYQAVLTYRQYFLKTDTSESNIVTVMSTYLEKERIRANLMSAQVQLQRDIIDVLHGKKIESGKSVDVLAQEGSTLNGKFIALQSEIEQIQKQLGDLLGS